jgi:uncharacterized membrane protein YfcA
VFIRVHPLSHFWRHELIWAALLGALMIGLSLGLLGSGGSILTVPVLVLVLHRPEKIAIAESLGIVGGIALVGAMPYALRRQIHWKIVLTFGLPGMLGAYLGAIAAHGVDERVLLAIFAAVMLLASWMMLRGPKVVDGQAPRHTHLWQIAVDGLLVGALTGFVGVGGGFLIVPALVLLIGLPMRLAIGTSLCIIALNAVSGFFKHLHQLADAATSVDWNIIVLFLAVGVVGSFAGNLLGTKLNQQTLRRTFGYVLIAMSVLILTRNVWMPGIP